MHSNLPLTFNYGLLYDLYMLIGAKGGLYILYMWMFCFMISLLHFLFVAERLWSCLNCSDIPMAQFIINMNASMPQSQKFIIHILDSTHLFVQPNMAEMIRSAIAEFRDQNSYEKPAWLHFFFFSLLFIFAVLRERCNGVDNCVSSLMVSSTGQSVYFSVKRTRLSNNILGKLFAD